MEKFLTQAKGLTKNPLGIIALFISLIYGFACLVLSTSISNLKTPEERLPLIWFIISFPIIIMIGFIFLVIKHHGKLYSPSDYGNVESFLRTIEGAKKFDPVQVEIENTKPAKHGEHNIVEKVENINLNKGLFSPQTKDNVNLANQFFRAFQDAINKKSYRVKFKEISFGAQAPEYFILTCAFQKEALRKNANSKVTVIIRVTRDITGDLKLIGIGKDIIETDPIEFSNEVIKLIDKLAENLLQ